MSVGHRDYAFDVWEDRRGDRRCSALMLAALVACAACIAGAGASAQTLDSTPSLTDVPRTDDPRTPAGSWYVVGNGTVDRFAGFHDRFALGETERQRVSLGLTFSNGGAGRAFDFTASAPGDDRTGDDRFTFLVSGAYDWHTGTIVTPRFMAGVGVSYLNLETGAAGVRQDTDGGQDVAPAMQVGFGADVAISSSLDLSAEYRASYRGAGDNSSAERETQIDQKFMLGAKIRF